MRKIMLLAAMLAMVLAAAAPALAQGGDQGPVAGDDAIQTGDNIQYSAVSQNILGSVDAVVIADVDATNVAVAGDDAVAVQEIANEASVSVSQSNQSLNNVWWWF